MHEGKTNPFFMFQEPTEALSKFTSSSSSTTPASPPPPSHRKSSTRSKELFVSSPSSLPDTGLERLSDLQALELGGDYSDTGYRTEQGLYQDALPRPLDSKHQSINRRVNVDSPPELLSPPFASPPFSPPSYGHVDGVSIIGGGAAIPQAAPIGDFSNETFPSLQDSIRFPPPSYAPLSVGYQPTRSYGTRDEVEFMQGPRVVEAEDEEKKRHEMLVETDSASRLQSDGGSTSPPNGQSKSSTGALPSSPSVRAETETSPGGTTAGHEHRTENGIEDEIDSPSNTYIAPIHNHSVADHTPFSPTSFVRTTSIGGVSIISSPLPSSRTIGSCGSSFDGAQSLTSSSYGKIQRFISSPQFSLSSANSASSTPLPSFHNPCTPHGSYHVVDPEENPFAAQFMAAMEERIATTMKTQGSQENGLRQSSASTVSSNQDHLPASALNDPGFMEYAARLDCQLKRSDYISYKIALIGDRIDQKYDQQLTQAFEEVFTEVWKSSISWESFSFASRRLLLQGRKVGDGIFMIPCFGRRILEGFPHMKDTVARFTQQVLETYAGDWILESGGLVGLGNGLAAILFFAVVEGFFNCYEETGVGSLGARLGLY